MSAIISEEAIAEIARAHAPEPITTCKYCGKEIKYGIPQDTTPSKYKKYHTPSQDPRWYHVDSGANGCDCRAEPKF